MDANSFNTSFCSFPSSNKWNVCPRVINTITQLHLLHSSKLSCKISMSTKACHSCYRAQVNVYEGLSFMISCTSQCLRRPVIHAIVHKSMFTKACHSCYRAQVNVYEGLSFILSCTSQCLRRPVIHAIVH